MTQPIEIGPAPVHVSNHALRRIRERMGLPRRAVRRLIQRALAASNPVSEVDSLVAHEGSYMRAYGRWVFVFSCDDHTVITVLPRDGIDVLDRREERMERGRRRIGLMRQRLSARCGR